MSRSISAIPMPTESSRQSPYVLIAGRGRSGTNFLLELLDLSPHTHTRNEPNKLEGTRMAQLPGQWRVRDQDASIMEAHWDQAVHEAAFSMGERDHLAKAPKDFLRAIPRRLGLYKMVDGPRSRRILRTFIPSLRGAEWPLPRWIGNYRQLARALPILKINQSPGWIEWVLAHRPQARVLHIARHPGGFLNSWRNRWLTLQDRKEVRKLNYIRLATIADLCPQWAARFGDVEAMSVEESELWFWCYTNEVIYQAGRDSPNYMLVVYERLSSRAVEVAKEVYEFCGIDWTQEIAEKVREASADSPAISNSWQEKLSRQQIELVNRIFSESSISTWWR